MKNTSLVIAAGALAGLILTAAPLQAGPGKAPAPLPPADMPLDNLLDPIETTLSTGFDSLYNFRGTASGQNAIWTGLDFALPLGLPVGNFVANFGMWYINPTDANQNSPNFARGAINGGLDDELDLYASLGTTIGAFDVSVGWTHYSYLDGGGGGATATPGAGGGSVLAPGNLGDQDEVGINIGTTVDTPFVPLDLGVAYYYNFDTGDPRYFGNVAGDANTAEHAGGTGHKFMQHYFEGSIGTSFDITDRMALAIGASAGFYTEQFSHVTYRAALPIQVAENVVFEPYIAYNQDHSSGNLHDQLRNGGSGDANGVISPGGGGGTDSDIFAGVSLSVSF